MRRLGLVITPALLLAACGGEEEADVTYSGEGEQWEATLEMTEVSGNNDSDQSMVEHAFTITYQGEETDLLGDDDTGEITAGYLSEDGEASSSFEFNRQTLNDPTFEDSRNLSAEITDVTAEDTIEVFIEWDGENEETFEIKPSE
ncbi:hypothetical protein [Jeotgalibacillus malaysiensis]|uniref:hypothetical protein n=1 Tax=Jeotgalibacillus malaysiensis TaxID=1508404 RepID=UPI00384FC817